MTVPGNKAASQDAAAPPSTGGAEGAGREWVAEVDVADSDKLRERVAARWEALIDKDFDRAYKFQTPEYRKDTSLDDYSFRMARGVVRWHLAALKEVRYHAPTEAEALINLEYSFALPGSDRIARTTGLFSDWWSYREGVWWHRESAASMSGAKGVAP